MKEIDLISHKEKDLIKQIAAEKRVRHLSWVPHSQIIVHRFGGIFNIFSEHCLLAISEIFGSNLKDVGRMS